MTTLELLMESYKALGDAIRKEQLRLRRKRKEPPMDEIIQAAIDKRNSKLFIKPKTHGKS